jgi:hypothetical protein
MGPGEEIFIRIAVNNIMGEKMIRRSSEPARSMPLLKRIKNLFLLI